ncbi:MAG: AAA family ATPase [Bacteroides sp.]
MKETAMIHKLILKNFKKVKEETFLFNNFDLLVGANNSGKSTPLQALAIWQFCIEQFRQSSNRNESKGTQVVLPNFTALPLPEFNLLWTDKTEREYISKAGSAKKDLNYILVTIDVYWRNREGAEESFCVQLRYQSPQAVYAIPAGGWRNFIEKEETGELPSLVYVPPFSGLEPHEPWLDDGNVRQHIGKSQPGSVLRNLLFRVINRENVPLSENHDWKEIHDKIEEWFGVDLLAPKYKKKISTEIKVEYQSNGKTFDVISGGSKFYQILTLLAFYYGYPLITTILFDEPDAHLHTNLQRKIIGYFLTKQEKQFLIATHSTEFINKVDLQSILSIMSGAPKRVGSTEETICALSDVDNNDVLHTQESPYILYLEGEDDNRILSAWANVLGKTAVYEKYYPYILGGTTKQFMRNMTQHHFTALQLINLAVKRVQLIDDYSASQNLTLPPSATWRDVQANVFAVVDGKKLLFENKDALFFLIKNVGKEALKINRQAVASSMLGLEIHQDILDFFEALEYTVQS